MPAQGRGRPRRRDRAAKKEWLAEKRQQPSSGLPPAGGEAGAEDDQPANGRRLWAEEDFEAYYAAQSFFGSGSGAEAEFGELSRTLRTPLPVTVRVSKSSPVAAGMEERLLAHGWERRQEFDRAGLSIWQLDNQRYASCRAWVERENRNGSLVFQEAVSLIPALLLRPEPSHLCLDLCAAPGSKSLQLLDMMECKAAGGNAGAGVAGAVLSSDSDPKRCCLALTRNLAKSGSPATCAALVNARDFPSLVDASGDGNRVEFNRILADVPCSGDGTLRKNAQAWRAWNRKEGLGLHTLQRKILLRGLYLLPPEGMLVYSTCSLNPIENEAVVQSALQRWRARGGDPIELVDTPAVCADVCDLPVSPGLETWLVPAPRRGGPLFARWEDVPPEENGEVSCPLHPEMFAEPGGASDVPVGSRCARFYPHKGNVGGFFVALFRKAATRRQSVPRSLEPGGDGQETSASSTKGHGLRQHPLVHAKFTRIDPAAAAWLEIVEFFGVDKAWVEQKMSEGLLFWQTLNHKEQPERVALVSPAVARLWEARSLQGGGSWPALAWVRLGTFIFEQLPRKFLTGIVSSRWRAVTEGAPILARALQRRRVGLLPVAFLAMLKAPHRQIEAEELPSEVLHPFIGEADQRHACGAVLIGIVGWPDSRSLPGVLTPRLLRLLVDDEIAAALEDELLAHGVTPPEPSCQDVPEPSCQDVPD